MYLDCGLWLVYGIVFCVVVVFYLVGVGFGFEVGFWVGFFVLVWVMLIDRMICSSGGMVNSVMKVDIDKLLIMIVLRLW